MYLLRKILVLCLHLLNVNRYTFPIIDITCTKENVMEGLSRLKEFSAHGPDSIPSKLLKDYATYLAEPLRIIFNKSLSTGEIPAAWKLANVTPIYKKGKKCEPANYRPISLTSVPCKLLEGIIKKKIVEHLDINNLINNTQHGFTSNKSTTTNLIEFFNRITKDTDDGAPVDLLYLDFSKAFDKVPHRRLIAKLQAHGIEGNILKWIENWLHDRKQRTVLNGKSSTWAEVLSGVPQGSVLGPLLFLIFINDLDDWAAPVHHVSKFADDTKVGHRVTSITDQEEFQSIINKLADWASVWGMEYNVDKCHILHIGRTNSKYTYKMNDTVIPMTNQEKDIGVIISDSLMPSKHCEAIASKAMTVLYQITRSFHYRDKHTFVQLYKTYVCCILDYASPSWSPWLRSDIDTIEKVQKRMVGMVPGLRGNSYEEKLAELGIQSLEARRQRADMIQTFKLINGFDKVDITNLFEMYTENARVTRLSTNPLNIIPPRANTDIRRKFFTHRIINAWNGLPADVKESPSVTTFKRNYDKYNT